MAATSIESSGPPAVTIPDMTAAAQLPAVFDAGFLQRLCFCGTLVARSYLAAASPTAAEVNYSRQFLADPMAMVSKSLVWEVITDGLTNAGSSDQEIANRLGDVWPLASTGYG